MNKSTNRVSLILLVGLLLLGICASSLPRTSQAAPPARPRPQTQVANDEVASRLRSWFSSAFAGYCFNNWISLGKVSQVQARLDDSDVEVYIDPEFLEGEGAAAAYVDYSYAGLEYFNDIVLADVPAKVPAQTLWHETMHAIFDDHDSELSDLGVTTDERYTWYMELATNAVRNTLTMYEKELKKGEDCDSETLQGRWNLFVKQMEDARNTNGHGYITDAQLRQLESLTGFRVDVEEIKQGYASGACGECGKKAEPVATLDSLDLIFCIDVTGSMDDDIASVKAAAANIVNTIAAKNDDYRVALIAYRDWEDSEGYAMFEDFPFSSDKDAIIANINSLSVGGGDDEPEAVFEALMRAIDSKAVGGWRHNVNKQLIVMGDAPPHNPSRQGYTAASVAQAAWDADPVVIQALVVGNDGYYSPEAVEVFRELADLTDGNFFEADNADAVPEMLQKSIEVIESPASSTFELNSQMLLIGAGSLTCVTFIGLLVILALVRKSRRRPAPQPVAPRRAASRPARPDAAWQEGKTVITSPTAEVQLVVIQGTDTGQRFSLQSSNRIGRAKDNEIILRDNQVSRYHAVINSTPSGYTVTDLGSANGTWVNGNRIAQPRPLRPGDELTIGADRLVLQRH